MRIEADLRHPRQQHGVPIGLRLGDRSHRDDAVRAGAVVDDDGLPEILRQPVADETGYHIAARARGLWHDHPDRPVWKRILGLGTAMAQHRRANKRGSYQTSVHQDSPIEAKPVMKSSCRW